MSAADKDAEIAALRQQNATLQARVKELETGTARLSVRLSGTDIFFSSVRTLSSPTRAHVRSWAWVPPRRCGTVTRPFFSRLRSDRQRSLT